MHKESQRKWEHEFDCHSRRSRPFHFEWNVNRYFSIFSRQTIDVTGFSAPFRAWMHNPQSGAKESKAYLNVSLYTHTRSVLEYCVTSQLRNNQCTGRTTGFPGNKHCTVIRQASAGLLNGNGESHDNRIFRLYIKCMQFLLSRMFVFFFLYITTYRTKYKGEWMNGRTGSSFAAGKEYGTQRMDTQN